MCQEISAIKSPTAASEGLAGRVSGTVENTPGLAAKHKYGLEVEVVFVSNDCARV